MKRFWLVLCFVSFAVFAADPFELPKGTTVINKDASGRTWAFNGMLKSPLETTKNILKTSVLKSGFKLKHEIPMDEKGKEHLILAFVKDKETLILMLWSPDGKNTFFSYGISK